MSTRALDIPAAGREHIVRFYETDWYLCEVVGRFLHEGLNLGEAALVIATAEHRAGFDRALQAAGVDVGAFKERGQLIAVDAEETLSRFMVGDLATGAVDPEAFERVVGGLMTTASMGGVSARVRAFGEMVDLLFRRGNEAATRDLEELWNRLIENRPVQLCCAYRLSGFDHARHSATFHAICRLHSSVFPSESYHAPAEPEAQRRRIAELEQRVRALESELAKRDDPWPEPAG